MRIKHFLSRLTPIHTQLVSYDLFYGTLNHNDLFYKVPPIF